MTSDDFLDFQEIIFREWIRNMILFATLPFYLTQQTQRNCVGNADGARTSNPSSIAFLDQYRNDRHEERA